MGPASGLSSSGGSLHPWASEPWLLFSQRPFSGPPGSPFAGLRMVFQH